ncbi:MAG: hypothetical protein ABI840_06610 [bacterium]
MEEALQYTQLITNIIIILLFIGLVILVFNLIKQFKKVTEKIEGFSSGFNEIKPKILESLDKINSLSDNVNKVVTKVNQNVDVLGTVVDKVKETAESIIDFEKKIQSRIEPPVMDTVKTISGISAGVKTFFDVWKNRKTNKVNSDYSDEKFDELRDSMDEVNKELEEVNLKLSDLQK